ncbi:50S ribosomal protein L35 [Myxococcota bacterium]|nr:50S ribosomal protein L35 [Myxococcota bacterium]
MAKYKLKTKRSAAKRYRVTGKGRIKVGRKGKQHIFTNKSQKRKRHLRGTTLLKKCDERMAKNLLPYG